MKQKFAFNGKTISLATFYLLETLPDVALVSLDFSLMTSLSKSELKFFTNTCCLSSKDVDFLFFLQNSPLQDILKPELCSPQIEILAGNAAHQKIK